jgi:alkylation response protein AidB-like acyl-CoA dehydrogenase
MAVETAAYTEQTDIQRDITEMVRQLVDEQIIPNAEKYDHEDSFPEPIVEQMKELSRGWISISGVVNTHFIGSYLLMRFGSDEQKEHFLPKMATGEIRAAFSLSEPEVGSDVQGIKATAKKSDDGKWELHGQKMWVTNGLGSSVVFVLTKTDPKADPPYKGMTCFITEKEPWKEVNEGDFAGSRCRQRSRRWATRASSRPSSSTTATAVRRSGCWAARRQVWGRASCR